MSRILKWLDRAERERERQREQREQAQVMGATEMKTQQEIRSEELLQYILTDLYHDKEQRNDRQRTVIAAGKREPFRWTDPRIKFEETDE